MSEIINNTQTQQTTNSNQGTNRVPKLDAKSFFFLEDGVFTQQANNAFDIISDNEFRTTSLVTISAKKIISICSGQVFLQPYTGDDDKVNLILKPYRQPVAGLAIKYFIYRGLPKNQFLDSSNKVLTTGSGLITHIRTEFNNFYQQDASLTSQQPELFGKYIGYPDSAAPTNEAQVGTDLIDEYFYKISQTFEDETGDITNAKRAFEMPMIPAGLDLTTAISGEIGLDIVLNYGDYYIENDPNPFKLDLNFARAPHNIINVSAITDAYQKKLMRENIIQFIDPAAFYGLHANGGKISKFGVTAPIETPADIYTLISPFVTKNTIYIYVQSNRQRSYNFYNKYAVSETNTNNLKIGLSEATLAETTFETNSWPVKVFSTAPVASSTKQTIALQFTTDKNPNVSLYGDMANIGSANQENFVDATDLIPIPVEGIPATPFTKTILLHSPIANNQNIASFIQLLYIGKNIILSKPGVDDGDPATPPPDDILFTTKYMDDVFDLIDATSFLQADKIYHVHSYKPILYNQQEIDKNRKRVIAFTQRTQNTIAVSETENLTLFTYLAIVENEQSSHSNYSPNASSNKEATGYGVQSVGEFYTVPNLPSSEFVKILNFSNGLDSTKGLQLRTTNNSNPTSMILGITEQENTSIKDFIAQQNFNNPRLFLSDSQSRESDYYISSEDIKFKTYYIDIISENNSGEIIHTSSGLNVKVYSLDGLVFFSSNYAKYAEFLDSSIKMLKLEV